MKNYGHVLVIGAKNKPDALDLALWRYGFFDHDIFVDVPHEKDREKILSILTSGLILAGSSEFKKVAKCTPSFLGIDLEALTREETSVAIKRII